jgi:hypothetical protein
VSLRELADPMRDLELPSTVEIAPDEDLSFRARAGAKPGVDFTANDRPRESRVVVTIRPDRLYAADLSAG